MSSLARIDSIELAYYILGRIKNVKHLKLQKLIYYIEAWHLAVFGESIVRDEFEAWLHGPVSRKVWREFKDASQLYAVITADKDRCRQAERQITRALDEDQVELIEDVLKEYGSKTAYHLEMLTHREQPWIEARKGVPDGAACSTAISKSLMKKYYAARLEK